MDLMIQILLGIVPSLGVGLLFYLVIKSLVEGDRRERRAYAQWQARQDAEEVAAAVAPANDAAAGPHARTAAAMPPWELGLHGTNGPEPQADPPMNRHERRRLEAMQRAKRVA